MGYVNVIVNPDVLSDEGMLLMTQVEHVEARGSLSGFFSNYTYDGALTVTEVNL